MATKIVDQVLEERGSTYGSYSCNADNTISMLNIDSCDKYDSILFYTGFMVASKFTRENCGKHHSDNFVDIVGYLTLFLEEFEDVDTKEVEDYKDLSFKEKIQHFVYCATTIGASDAYSSLLGRSKYLAKLIIEEIENGKTINFR